LGPPKPVTLDPYLAPPPGLAHASSQQQRQQVADWSPASSPFSLSPPGGSSFPFPPVGHPSLLPPPPRSGPFAPGSPTTALDDHLARLSLNGYGPRLDGGGTGSSGGGASGGGLTSRIGFSSQSTSPGGSSELSSAFGLEDASPASKDAALQLLSRKIIEVRPGSP